MKRGDDVPARRHQADPKTLSHIKNLLEGYDHLAVMSTVDGKKGIFELLFTEGMSGEVAAAMDGIRGEVPIREV